LLSVPVEFLTAEQAAVYGLGIEDASCVKRIEVLLEVIQYGEQISLDQLRESIGDGEMARARRGGAAGGAVAGIDSPYRATGASGFLGRRLCSW
jgi:hypothetical protein